MAIVSSNTSMKNIGSGSQNYTFALSVLTTLFFLWGFLTCLNDIIIPQLKSVFTLNYLEAMLVQFAFFMAYFIVSIPAGFLMKKIGYQKGIVLGLIIMGIACLLFIPSASLRLYPLFLSAFFLLAIGITILQVAANPYVAVLGKPEAGASRLNLAQAFNSLGTTLAPLLGAVVILKVASVALEKLEASTKTTQDVMVYNKTIAHAIATPYTILAIILFLIAIFFIFVKLPKIQGLMTHEHDHDTQILAKKSAWRYKHLLLGAIAIFCYVGAEVSIGSFLVNYISQSFILGCSIAVAGGFVAYYWAGAMIGRFIGAGVQKKISAYKVLTFNVIVAIILVIISMISTGHIALWAILAVGLFNSVMFPTIFVLSIEDLGIHTNQGSGILCAAIVGGAIIPIIQGFFADIPEIGIHHAFFIPVLCYIYIFFFAVKGHKH